MLWVSPCFSVAVTQVGGHSAMALTPDTLKRCSSRANRRKVRTTGELGPGIVHSDSSRFVAIAPPGSSAVALRGSGNP